MHLNLLPSSFRLRLLIRTSLRRWCVIWGTAVACALTYCLFQSREVFSIADRVAALDVQCQPLRELESDIVVQQERLSQLQKERVILEQLQPDQHSMHLLGLLSHSAGRTRGKVQLQRFNYVAPAYQYVATSSPATQASASPSTTLSAAEATVSLQGLAADDDALADFVAALREEGVFQRVELKASSQLRTQTGSNRQYQLECRF